MVDDAAHRKRRCRPPRRARGAGGGAAVLFLRVGSSGRTWEWLPDELTRGRRIVRVDLRGHGRSDHAPGTYVVPRYGADVAAVLRSVASRPAVVVGNSLGGVIAWWLAQNHPEPGHGGVARGSAAVRRRDAGGRGRAVQGRLPRRQGSDPRGPRARAVGGGAGPAHRHDPLGPAGDTGARRAPDRGRARRPWPSATTGSTSA